MRTKRQRGKKGGYSIVRSGILCIFHIKANVLGIIYPLPVSFCHPKIPYPIVHSRYMVPWDVISRHWQEFKFRFGHSDTNSTWTKIRTKIVYHLVSKLLEVWSDITNFLWKPLTIYVLKKSHFFYFLKLVWILRTWKWMSEIDFKSQKVSKVTPKLEEIALMNCSLHTEYSLLVVLLFCYRVNGGYWG
mgnify:CR=1 FL=1